MSILLNYPTQISPQQTPPAARWHGPTDKVDDNQPIPVSVPKTCLKRQAKNQHQYLILRPALSTNMKPCHTETTQTSSEISA